MASLADLLLGFGTGALEEGQTQRGERRRAHVEAQAKAAYDPDIIWKFRLLNLARQAGMAPQPAGGYNPVERQAGVPAAVSGAAQEREMNVLRHLLPRSAMGTSVFITDPVTGTTSPSPGGSNLPPHSRIIPGQKSPEQAGATTRERELARQAVLNETLPQQETRATRLAAAKEAGAPDVTRTTTKQSARTALTSIKEMRTMLDPDYGGDPSLLLSGGLPGIAGSRKLAKALANVKLEIVTARGGKQLTPSEQVLVKATFPNSVDAIDALLRQDPSVIQDTLDKMQFVQEALIQGLEPQMVQQQLQSFSTSSSPRGGRKMRDANGNEAIVYPDGTVEEL